MVLALLIATFISSALLTYAIRYFAHKKELLDHPNERSSHTVATPKGGGLAIMVSFYMVLTLLFFNAKIDTELFLALLSGLPVLAISLIDDLYPLSSRLRFGVQLFSATAALYFLGGVATLDFGLFSLHGIWLNLIALIGIIWITNLYNFLDGIDGYAASEALFVGGAAYLLFGSDIALFLAVASGGFLLFNWDKASIFMGDVGSAPLGFIFAVLIVNDAGSVDFVAWLMLLSLFWFDATYTLLRRAKRKEKLSEAHKKHVYQRLTQAGLSHSSVVLLAMAFNLLIFFILYLLPPETHLYLFILLVVSLYGVNRYIDTIKAFE